MLTSSNAIPVPEAQKSVIRIPGTEIIPRIQPAIAVGEVLRMVVRNNSQGQGQLYFRGMLIPAMLPETLAAGDKIFAKVTQADKQLVLKLLETQSGNEPDAVGNPPGAQTPLVREFESLVKGATLSLMKSSSPLTVPTPPAPGKAGEPAEATKSTELLTKTLEQLVRTIGNSETLVDSSKAHAQLLDAATGKVAVSLRETADRIRSLLGEPASAPSRFLAALKSELGQLVESSTSDNRTSAHHLDLLMKSLTDELKPEKKTTPKERELLKAALKDLEGAKEAPEKRAPQIESVIRRLHQAFEPAVKAPLDPQTMNELQQIASRLEQLASSQETLTQLNPIMRAIGEPALILFPFLAQGLLTQSEVSIESRMEGNGKNAGRQTADDSESADTTAYQRIQVSVPLPTLGDVHVDIAHRKDEILVRFSILDPEAETFLLEQLEHLGTTLRALSFTRMELMTHVGTKEDQTPNWLLAARGTTIIA